jgi:low temperature requirement protein LtrA
MSTETSSEPAVKVSTLELFFDLIFVFTITQLTELVIEAHTLLEWLRIPALLAIIWWMYAGYVWVTNNVNLQQFKTRALLLLAMAGFLVMALAIPFAFDFGGLAFAAAYFVVVLIHFMLFNLAQNTSSARAIWSIAPFNFGACLCLLLAGLLENPVKAYLWVLALVILISSSFSRRQGGFVLSPGHFAERHGLVILIVLGESVVGIGVGAKSEPFGLSLILACLLGLTLCICLWWVYFDGDDSLAEHALAAASGTARMRIAMLGYGFAHLLLILGIVISAAGIKQMIAQLNNPPQAAAWGVGVGVAIYLCAQAWFRQIIGIKHSRSRLLAGIAVLATIPLGLYLGGLTQIAAMVLGLVFLTMFDKKVARASINP